VRLPITIVEAEAADAATLTEIAFAAKRHWGYPESWIQSWETSLTVTAEDICTRPFHIAELENEKVGFYGLLLENNRAALVDHLWVRPSAIRRGIGRALFLHAETTARTLGATLLKITSDPHAEGFYRHMGAITCGHQSAAMDPRPRFLPLMEKQLS
jgi:GNAT superfamily N-acetyltransferase